MRRNGTDQLGEFLKWMGRRILFCSLLAPASSFAQTENQTEPSPAQFRIESFSTLREARVLKRGEGHVPGLAREDFLVYEEGKLRAVEYLEERRNVPLSIALLVDVGSSMNQEQVSSAKRAVFDLIHLLEPADEILLACYDQDYHPLAELTQDRYQLVESLNNLSPQGRSGFWSRASGLFASSGHTGSAIDATLAKLVQAKHEAKVILVLSAAFASVGEATEEHVAMAGVRLFAVKWGNRAGDALNLWGDRTANKRLVIQSGGTAFDGDSVVERIRSVAGTLKSYYLLAYEAGDLKKDLEKRSLRIEIKKHPEYEVFSAPRVALARDR